MENCQTETKVWPYIPGEYYIFDDTKEGCIAVTTLTSRDLSDRIHNKKPKGLCIIGSTETENIGIEKVIKNIITNPYIKYLIVSGLESKGHETGQSIISLGKNGADKNKRIIDSQGKKPVLTNASFEEINRFRKQTEIINMIGCIDEEEIIKKIYELNKRIRIKPIFSKLKLSETKVIKALEKDPLKVGLDKAGYFVILSDKDKKIIIAEHYSYENKLLRIIEGKNARNIYWTIIENGWVTELSHAAYLGKELTRAEMSIEYEFKYIQDKA